MRFRVFDARRARSEHARGLGPDDDRAPRACFPGGRAHRGDPFSTVSQPFDETRLGEARDVAERRGRRARAAPRCAAREKEPTCGGRARASGTAVPRSDAEAERPKPEFPSEAFFEPSCRFCFEGPGAGALISPCACSGTQAHVHIKCLRRWQRTTRASDGGRTCHVCRRMFLAPPLSLAERVARSVFVAARARAIPFALLSARLAVDLAREESATFVLRGRGPLAYAAALVAFLMDCERLHRFSAADVWENAHAHLATVALQGVLTKAVERSARAFRDVSENAYVADPMAGWVHFAHDVLNFPHLMTLCYGFLCVDADRAPAVAAVRGMRTRGGAARRARDAEGRLEKSVAALLEALGLFDGGADRTGVVAETRRALMATARWLERAIGAGGETLSSMAFATGTSTSRDAARWDAPWFGDFFAPSW
jgi:hypothetical protein